MKSLMPYFFNFQETKSGKLKEVEEFLRILATGTVRPLNFGEYMSAQSG